MSLRDSNGRSREHTWPACVGDFPILKDFLAEKNSSSWFFLQSLDALLRGFSQVVFANNPISGLLIAIGLALTSPGTFISCSITAVLGILLSMLMQDSQERIENGLTVYNPLLIGAISYAVVPKVYGAFDSFSILLTLLATIFSVYLARSLGSDKFPCLVWPLNLAGLVVLFVLNTHTANSLPDSIQTTVWDTNNVTTDASIDRPSFIAENVTSPVVWGMILRGIVTSASQTFAVNDVAFGSVVYLGILIYSPTTALFSFIGALFGTLAGLELSIIREKVYTGFWGYNSLLTGAALGGNLLVINGHTVAATFVAIIYTVVLQYVVDIFFNKINMPIITVPFVVSTSLFLRLRGTSDDDIFPSPATCSFPEKQRHDYVNKKKIFAVSQIDDADETKMMPGDLIKSHSFDQLA